QHKRYCTYNGGGVFNLTQSASSAAAGDKPQTGAEDPNEPQDAAAFSRRGTAFAARRDFEHAIADLTRACELNPNEASYFYQRGEAHRENAQLQLAAADFDQALKLKPDDVPSLMARARLRLAAGDSAGMVADLDVVQQTVSRQANVRFELGILYLRARQFDVAIAQYNLWISAHPDDARMPDAFSNLSM